MEYVAMAVSNEKTHVNASPSRFTVNTEGSDNIREYVISRMGQLTEISKDLAINSPRYILIRYADESERYFKYECELYNIFPMAACHKVEQNVSTSKTENSYAILNNVTTDSVRYVKPTYTATPTYTQSSVNRNTSAPPKRKSMLGKIVIGVLIILGFFLVVGPMMLSDADTSSTHSATNTTPSLTTPTPSPVSEPQSGAILSGSEVYNGSEITITASGGESCVVKLKTSSGITRLSFYVRAGETVTIGVPAENLYIYFASGKTWYGINNLFGEYTSYSMDDEILDFTEYTWEYTLYPVNNGNFSETPIDASEF